MYAKSLASVVLVGAGLILSWAICPTPTLFVLNAACANAIAVVGLAFVLGLAGQMVLSQAAFVGIGAYSTAILSGSLGCSPFLALPIAGIVAAVFGFIVGYPCLRLTGHYLALTTIGFGIILQLVLQNWTALTGGPEGMSILQPAALLGLDPGPRTTTLCVVDLVLLATVYTFVAVKQSHLGRSLEAIRENELAAATIGIDVGRVKLLAFLLCAFFGGIAGGLSGVNIGFVSPEGYGLEYSILLLVMCVIGGSSSVYGAVMGGILLTFLPEWLRPLKAYYLLIYGVILMILVVYLPTGIAGLMTTYLGRVPRGVMRLRLGERTSDFNPGENEP